MVTKIDFEELDTAEDGSGETLRDGMPFTGIAYERDPNTGAFIAVAGFFQGGKHGPWRSWYANGRLRSERFFFRRFRHGPWREWHENGQLAYDGYWECDLLIRRKRWDSNGLLLEHHEMTADSRDFPTLQKRRTERTWQVIDIDPQTLEFLERPSDWGRDGTERV